MPLNGAATNSEIDASMGSILLLNSSCQAVIEAEITEVSSPWYDQLDHELGAAENLVVGWRRSGVLYFQTDILDTIADTGQAFTSAGPKINGLFAALEQNFSAAGKAELIAAMQGLEPAVQALIQQIADYLAKLGAFEQNMLQADQAMRTTVEQDKPRSSKFKERSPRSTTRSSCSPPRSRPTAMRSPGPRLRAPAASSKPSLVSCSRRSRAVPR